MSRSASGERTHISQNHSASKSSGDDQFYPLPCYRNAVRTQTHVRYACARPNGREAAQLSRAYGEWIEITTRKSYISEDFFFLLLSFFSLNASDLCTSYVLWFAFMFYKFIIWRINDYRNTCTMPPSRSSPRGAATRKRVSSSKKCFFPCQLSNVFTLWTQTINNLRFQMLQSCRGKHDRFPLSSPAIP